MASCGESKRTRARSAASGVTVAGASACRCRMRAVTRRAVQAVAPNAPESEPDMVVGPLHISPSTRIATIDDKPLALTPVEFDILAALARAKGRVKSRERLLEEICDREWEVFDRSIDMHISALRKKLGDDVRAPRFIRTLRSAGYMLLEPGQS